MSQFHAFVAAVNRWFLTASGAIILVVLGVILWDIVARNVFNAPTMWALDTSRFALVFIFFLALAPALESGAHVAVDIVYEHLPTGPRRALQQVAQVLVIGFSLLLLWFVYQETRESFVDDGSFSSTIPMKMKYVYWIGPVGTLQFLLTSLSLLTRSAAAPVTEPAVAAHGAA